MAHLNTSSQAPRKTADRSAAPAKEYLDIIFYARNRWDGPLSRAHHIVPTFAANQRVFYLEPPVFERGGCTDFDVTCRGNGLFVVTPYIAEGISPSNVQESLRFVVNQLIDRFRLRGFISWYETADALRFSRHLRPRLVVYDYPRQAPLAVSDDGERDEAALLRLADIVFTATQSMYETVRRLRPGAAWLFPDCPDIPGRGVRTGSRCEAVEQSPISQPRVGVVATPDAPIDFELVGEIAALAPAWSFIVIGAAPPETKHHLDRPNIHCFGERPPAALADYVPWWDAAIFPIARTRGRPAVSIARLGEVLAYGSPIVASPATDIVGPLGRRGVVQLAETAEEFTRALPAARVQKTDPLWQRRCREYLDDVAWSVTARSMGAVIAAALAPALDEAHPAPAPRAASGGS